jgi:hypothetical protein
VIAFFDLLYFLRLKQDGEDRIWWIPSKRRTFEVRSFFQELYSLGGSPFPWKSIWRVNVPLRVSFFVWTVALGKILTLDNLRKRKVIVVDCCCICKKSGEFMDYLFLHCEVIRELWNLIFRLFGVEWVMLRRVIEIVGVVSWKGVRFLTLGGCPFCA